MSQTRSSFKQKHDADVVRVAMKLEVALIPVSDVNRAKEFYSSLGWRLDGVSWTTRKSSPTMRDDTLAWDR